MTDDYAAQDETSGAPRPRHRPHVVLIMTDQHRAGFTAGSGLPLDTMPFLDELASRGTRFHQAYTSAPACVPARTSLLTGRFPSAHRVTQNSTASCVVRGDDLLDVLRAAGYRLHFAGKPHMHRGPGDFDTYAGPYMHTSGPPGGASVQDRAFERWLRDLDHAVSGEPTPFPVESQFPHRIVTDALAALDTTDAAAGPDRPFFLWLSFPEPHNPYQAPEPYFSMFSPEDVPERSAGPADAEAKGGAWRWLRRLQEEKRPGEDAHWRRYRAVYCGMLRMVDDQVRRLARELESRGLIQDTVFIHLSDHGDYVGDYGLQRKGAGMPEGLMRIPLTVCGPGIQPCEDREHLVSIVDVLPTLCEALEQEIPLGVQGRSLWPVLQGRPVPEAEFATVYAERGFGGLPYEAHERPDLHFPYEGRSFDELNTVTQSGRTTMVRRGRWKLTYDALGEGELYDLSVDPAELRNLFDSPAHASVRSALVEDLLRWTIRVQDDLPQGDYSPKRDPHGWTAPYARPAPEIRGDLSRPRAAE